MSIRKSLFSFLLACLVGLLIITPALAMPPLPSSFYGQISVGGKNVPDGTVVRALVGGTVFAEARTRTYQGGSVYSLDVPGDDASSAAGEGGKEGDTVQFAVGGVLAGQTGTWHSGTNVSLNLDIPSGGPLETPPPTLTPVPTQTAITAGVQPTREPPALSAAASTGTGAGKHSGPGIVVAGLVVAGLAGGGAWIFLRGKRKA